MVRLLFILFVGALGWYGWRVFRRHQESVARSREEAEIKRKDGKALELEQDPKTGVYRPSERDE